MNVLAKEGIREREETEVAVVGGGPTGLVAALALARRGVRAVVLERAQPPIDKACGEGLMPGGVAILEHLGVDAATLGRPYAGISFVEDGQRAHGRFDPATPGIGLRRLTLHQALRERAEAVGVDLRWGVRVEGVDPESGVLRCVSSPGDGEHTLGARWILGADGLHSPTRRWAGLAARRPQPARRRRMGVRRHFALAPWSDEVEVHWSAQSQGGCEAYVTPVGEQEVGVALLWSGFKSSFDELLARFPELIERLRGAVATSHDRGAAELEQRVKGVARGRVLLIGDAAGYVDAITGEGLALGFHDALDAVSAIERGGARGARVARDYAVARRRSHRLPELLTRLLLFAERHPGVRRTFFSRLRARPARFDRLLALLTRPTALPP